MTKDDIVKRRDGIVAIDGELRVYVGYDQPVPEADATPDSGWDENYLDMVPATERVALADHMIALWQRYREAVKPGGA